MKYWSAGDVDSSVYDAFFEARKTVEAKVNEIVKSNAYGDEIDALDVIYVIAKKKDIIYKQTFKPKLKELDLRITINYIAFLESSPKEQKILLINSLIKGLENVSKSNKVKYFDFSKFIADLNSILI